MEHNEIMDYADILMDYADNVSFHLHMLTDFCLEVCQKIALDNFEIISDMHGINKSPGACAQSIIIILSFKN